MKDRSFPFELLRADAPRQKTFAVGTDPEGSVETIKLDQNELPDPIPADLMDEVARELATWDWNRYPQPQRYEQIKQSFGEIVGISPDCLLLTAGCDQLIQVVLWAAGGAGRVARLFEPTYPNYRALIRSTGTELQQVVLGPDFELSSDQVSAPGADLVFIVSPNNPTGTLIDRGVILAALEQPQLVLVDEAYVDYGGESAADLISECPNLVLGRSLSKAACAGARLGYGIAHPGCIEVLENLLFAPYHLNVFQLSVAKAFGLVKPHVEKSVARVVAEREKLYRELHGLSLATDGVLRVRPSHGNFLLISIEDASKVDDFLLGHGIRVRDVSSLPGLDSHLRVTVGTPRQNAAFYQAMKRYLQV